MHDESLRNLVAVVCLCIFLMPHSFGFVFFISFYACCLCANRFASYLTWLRECFHKYLFCTYSLFYETAKCKHMETIAAAAPAAAAVEKKCYMNSSITYSLCSGDKYVYIMFTVLCSFVRSFVWSVLCCLVLLNFLCCHLFLHFQLCARFYHIFFYVHVLLSSCQNRTWYAKFNKTATTTTAEFSEVESNRWQNEEDKRKILTLENRFHSQQLIECKNCSSLSFLRMWTNACTVFHFSHYFGIKQQTEQNSNNILDETQTRHTHALDSIQIPWCYFSCFMCKRACVLDVLVC